MQWKDKNGDFHPFNDFGGGNCNLKKPELKKDAGQFTDKNVLPITGFKYGTKENDIGSLTIKTGPLICRGEKKQCPFGSQLIMDNCYYFETRIMTFEEAMKNCILKFRSFNARLFEPVSKLQNDKVVEAAKAADLSLPYIGIDSRGSMNVTDFRYSTNSQKINFKNFIEGRKIKEWCVGPCVFIHLEKNGQWLDTRCREKLDSICEMPLQTPYPTERYAVGDNLNRCG